MYDQRRHHRKGERYNGIKRKKTTGLLLMIIHVCQAKNTEFFSKNTIKMGDIVSFHIGRNNICNQPTTVKLSLDGRRSIISQTTKQYMKSINGSKHFIRRSDSRINSRKGRHSKELHKIWYPIWRIESG